MVNDAEMIKKKLDIVDVVKSYVNLNPAGKTFKGLCPFHQEKDPSFIVSRERQNWYCFGCSEGGDVISFVMKYENMDFPEALRFLAEKAGVEISEIKGRDQKQIGTLYEINEIAKDFFMDQLKGNKEAIIYLRKRGLSENTIKDFGIGFCNEGDDLTVHLINKGFQLQDVAKSGLSLKKGGLHKDRFGGRIMFPIFNEIGSVVAFTGRVFPPDNEGEFNPKYINSPETPVYKKSKVLYGLDRSKKFIVDKRSVFLVEGQMDLLMVWQSGLKNVVAVSGTGLTQDHLAKLSRLADTVVVSFDNDAGGMRALERAIEIFGSQDFQIKAINLGDYNDPAEAIQSDFSFFKNSVKSAKPALNHLFNHYFDKEDLDPSEKKKRARHLLDKISKLKSAIDQDHWIKELSDVSRISYHALRSEFESISKNSDKKESKDQRRVNNIDRFNSKIDKLSYRLLVLGFTKDSFLSILKNNRKWFSDRFQKVIDDPSSEGAGIVEMESGLLSGKLSEENIKEEILDLLDRLKVEVLKEKKELIKNKLKEEKDEEKSVELTKEIHDLTIKIEEIKNK